MFFDWETTRYTIQDYRHSSLMLGMEPVVLEIRIHTRS